MAIVINFIGRKAFFKTVNSNHSTCFTYPAPPRTSLLGMIGAAKGLNFKDTLDRYQNIVDIGFKWDSENTTQIIVKKNIKYEGKSFVDKGSTLDGYEYIFEKKGGVLKGKIYINCKDKSIEDEIYNAFNNPVFPLCLGSAECVIAIEEINRCNSIKIDGEYNKGEMYNAPRMSKGYRKGYDFKEYILRKDGLVITDNFVRTDYGEFCVM